MKKQTFALCFGHRGFFPETLIAGGKKRADGRGGAARLSNTRHG